MTGERGKFIIAGVAIAAFSAVISAVTVIFVLRFLAGGAGEPPVIPRQKILGKIPGIDIKVGAPETPAQVFGECRELIQSKCSAVAGKYLELAKCLEKNRDQASGSCAGKLSVVNAVVLPCEEEFLKFCSASETGGLRVHKCLADRYADASERCQKALVPAGH